MRLPTPREELYRWHTEAVKGVYGDANDPHPDDPRCGWYKRTLARGGVFVPAQIWLFQEIDPDSGELLSDELLQCEVDGEYRDPVEQWSWLCSNPISEAEFHYLTALRRHAQLHEPELPFANPRAPVDWLKAPLPSFRKD